MKGNLYCRSAMVWVPLSERPRIPTHRTANATADSGNDLTSSVLLLPFCENAVAQPLW